MRAWCFYIKTGWLFSNPGLKNNKRCCLLLALCLYQLLPAQEAAFRHFGAANGLPSSETYCAIQDSTGYLWFGSDRGVVRYDGYEFSTLTSANGLPDNTVFAFYEDYRHCLWFNAYIPKVGYLDKGRPYVYPYNAQVKAVLKSGFVKGIWHDRCGQLWITSLASGSRQIELKLIDSLGRVHPPPAAPQAGVRDIYVDAANGCLQQGDVQAPVVRVISVQTGRELFRMPCSNSERWGAMCYYEKDSTLWLCTGGAVWSYRRGHLRQHLRYSDELLSFMVDEEKNLWLGFHHGGLLYYPAKTGYGNSIRLLPAYSVSGMCLDRERGKWFTTLEDGLFYLPPGFCFSYAQASGLQPSKIMQLAQVEGDMLAIQADWGVSIKRKNEQRFTRLPKPEALRIYDIGQGRADTFYYSANKVYRNFPAGRPVCIAMQSLVVEKDRVWGILGAGLVSRNSRGDVISDFRVADISRITSLLELSGDRLLLGTTEGLFEYHQGKSLGLGRYNPLLNARVAQLKRLHNGTIAVATIGQGLLLLRPDNYRQVSHFSLPQGLPSEMCHTLLEQGDSVLWIGTNKGLCRATRLQNRGQERFYTLDTDKGLSSNEITSLCLADEALWVGMQNGISVLGTQSPVNHQAGIPLFIEKIVVNGTEQLPLADAAFAYFQNNITLAYTGIKFQQPGKLIYKYRLRGADSVWKTTRSRSLIYNALAPGSYVFELSVNSPGDRTSGKSISWAFRILPPFWQRWWFMVLAGIFGMMCIYGLVIYRVRVVRRQMTLRQELGTFRDKALRAQMNPHFIYNSMNAIQNYITRNETNTSLNFLSRFSKLMRLTFQNSQTALVVLASDLEALQLYAGMERMRFGEKFTFHIELGPGVKPQTQLILPLVIQPFVENAILHGFTGLEREGQVRLSVQVRNDSLYVSITDDGIGRQSALALKWKKQKYATRQERRESGITVTAARIQQAWGRKWEEGKFKITDLYDRDHKPAGTCVEFYLPLNYDKTTFS